MVGTERVLEYTKLPPEAELINPDVRPPPNWPSAGRIEFKDVSYRYSGDTPIILKNLSITVQAGEKVVSLFDLHIYEYDYQVCQYADPYIAEIIIRNYQFYSGNKQNTASYYNVRSVAVAI